jgi:hypothetical protein
MSCVYEELALVKKIDQYDAAFMLYPSSSIFPGNKNIIKLQFDGQGRVIKRIGGLTPAPYFLGFDYMFNSEIYEELTYGKDLVTVQRKYGPSGTNTNYKKDIFFTNERISRIVTVIGPTVIITYPYYNPSGLVIKTVETQWLTGSFDTLYYSTTIRNFTYDAGNLVKIEGEEVNRHKYKYTIIEKFEDYDSAPNPTKHLIIFDEIYYRSLSRNNFRKYSYEWRNTFPGPDFRRSERSWTFQYDNRGVPVFY